MHPVALITITALLLMASAVSHSTTAATGGACAWDHPGRDPFIGDLARALDHYRDIPADARERLKSRMASHDYDDVVVITRDAIEGRQRYGSQITGMHFGSGRVCGTVTREGWDAQHREAGLVYCAGPHCVLVPSVCRNLSRIVPREGPGPGHPDSPPELVFEPPGAISPPVPPLSTPPDAPPTLVTPPAASPPGLSPPVALPPAFAPPPGAPPPLLVDNPPGNPPGLTTPPEVFWPPWWPPDEYAPPGISVPSPPVPEPQSWLLLILGIAALAFWLTRRR